LLNLRAAISDQHGDRLQPVAMVLETYSRNLKGKHQCLELFAGRESTRRTGRRWQCIAADSICSRSARDAIQIYLLELGYDAISFQLLVLLLSLLKDWNVCVSILPERKEILVSFACFGSVALQHCRTREPQVRQRV